MRVQLLDGWADLDRRLVERDKPLALTDKETALLRYLVEHSGRTIPRQELLSEVWGYRPGVLSRTLDTTVRRLRSKIEPAPKRPQLLLTATGVGYRWSPPRLSHRSPRGTSPRPPRAHVPVDPLPLVGRAEALRAVAGMLDGAPLLAVVGPGGVGKSRLARDAARAWSLRTGAEAWWVSIEGVTSVGGVVECVARALSLRLSSKGDRAVALGQRLARMSPLLVVLDGADDLDEAALKGIGGWAADAESLRVVLTLRARPALPVPVHRLRPLSSEAGRVLFERQVRTRLPTFEADAVALARVVRSLDGLPLTISLAAARVRVLGLEGLRRRLQRNSDVLRDPLDPSPHGALDRVLNRSWDLLDGSLRGSAVALSRVRGPFQWELGAELVEDADDLERLVDAAWLESAADGSSARLWMLDRVRAYLDGHASEEEREEVAGRFASYLAEHCAQHLDPLFGPTTPDACVWLRERTDDVTAAAPSALDPEVYRELVRAVGWAADRVGDAAAARRAWELLPEDPVALLELADLSLLDISARTEALSAARSRADSPRLKALVMLVRGRLGAQGDEQAESLPALQAAFSAFVKLADPVGAAEAARSLCFAHARQGDVAAAAQVRRQALDLVGEEPLLTGLELLLAPYPLPPDQAPTPAQLRRGLEQALAAGERSIACRLRATLALAMLGHCELEPALEQARTAIEAVAGLESPTLRAGVLGNAAIVLRELACFDEAASCLAAVVSGLPRGGHGEMRLVVGLNLAMTELDRGRLGRASAALDGAAIWVDGPVAQARVNLLRGVVARLLGGWSESVWRNCLSVFRAHDAPTHVARAAVVLATLNVRDSDMLLREARELAEAYSEVAMERAAEAVWMSRGHTAWSTPVRGRPRPEQWLSFVRIVNRLLSVGEGQGS